MLEVVLRQQGPFEPEQLVDELRRLGHRVSRATVYRTLGHLQAAGILRQVCFGNHQCRYEASAGDEVPDYLICVASGKVVEFDSSKLRKICAEICREHGFELVSHQLRIFGVSPEAKAKAGIDAEPDGQDEK